MGKIIVDEKQCVGCGQCVSVFPDNFDFDPVSGLSVVISQDNIVDDIDTVCPLGAIKIVEDDNEVIEDVAKDVAPAEELAQDEAE